MKNFCGRKSHFGESESDCMEVYPQQGPVDLAYPHQYSSSDSSEGSTSSMSSSAESEPQSENEIRHLALATRYKLFDPIYVASSAATTSTTSSSETDDAIVRSLQKCRKRLRKNRADKPSKAAQEVVVGMKFQRPRKIKWLLKGRNGSRWVSYLPQCLKAAGHRLACLALQEATFDPEESTSD